MIRTSLLLAVVLAAVPAAGLMAAPKITRITFAGDSANITETITGSGSGAAPAGVPCTSCTTPLLSFVNEWRCFNSNINITSWTDNKIIVSGLAANPGDAIVTLVTNSNSQGEIPPFPPSSDEISFRICRS